MECILLRQLQSVIVINHITMAESINRRNSSTEWTNATACGGTFLFIASLNPKAFYTSSFLNEPQQSMAQYHWWTQAEAVQQQNQQVFLYHASETAYTPWTGKENSGLSWSFCLPSSPHKDCRLKARAVGVRYVANTLDMLSWNLSCWGWAGCVPGAYGGRCPQEGWV